MYDPRLRCTKSENETKIVQFWGKFFVIRRNISTTIKQAQLDLQISIYTGIDTIFEHTYSGRVQSLDDRLNCCQKFILAFYIPSPSKITLFHLNSTFYTIWDSEKKIIFISFSDVQKSQNSAAKFGKWVCTEKNQQKIRHVLF